RQEWDRAVATEHILRRRHRDAAAPHLPADAAAQVHQQERDEDCVRGFLVYRGLLSQPGSLPPYKFAPTPASLEPPPSRGVSRALTSASRVEDDAHRYVPEPRAQLPYFHAASAYDPRTAIVHEGVHAQQLALGWKHENPVRRRFYDSVPNEGIAF